MSRLLLLCPEPLGGRTPAGVGIRFLETAKALVQAGHRVEILTPDGAAVEGCSAAQTTPAAIAAATAACDGAIAQGHVTNELFAHGSPVPTLVDLYDPYLVENFHYYATLGPQVFNHDHATLMLSLRRGDAFLCASEAQRLFYAGLLVAAGRVHPESFERDPALSSLLRLVPFGVQPPRAPRSGPPSHDVFFGAIYNWYDPVLAVESVALARRRLPDLTLTFTTHPNADLTPQGLFAETRRHVSRRGLEDAVRFAEWVPYQDRLPFYDRFGLALLTFPPSLETDLAMRTRMFDCFWAELPVVSSAAGGTDAILAEYGAGTVVRSQEPADYADAMVTLLEDRQGHARRLEGCRRWVAEHQWDRVLEPVLAFAADPRFDETKERFRQDVPPVRGPADSVIRRLARKVRGSL